MGYYGESHQKSWGETTRNKTKIFKPHRGYLFVEPGTHPDIAPYGATCCVHLPGEIPNNNVCLFFKAYFSRSAGQLTGNPYGANKPISFFSTNRQPLTGHIN
jgi:hypothetical protein